MIGEMRKMLKRLHYPLEVILVCARWYAAYPLSLRHIEEMMQERGVFVDHSTVHRWALKILGVVQKVPFLGNTGARGPAPEMDTISLWDGALKMRRVALQQSNQVR